MIRNSPFGRRLLENWMTFANGLCPNGNFNTTPGEYTWGDSDQPGIWWALPKTHSEFYHPEKPFHVPCNEATGFLETKRFIGPELRKYFNRVGVRLGHEGEDLERIQRGKLRNWSSPMQLENVENLTSIFLCCETDQPILWSSMNNDTRSGLGIQQTYGSLTNVNWPWAFASHTKHPLKPAIKSQVDACRKYRGCFAEYTEDGIFYIGCDHNLTGFWAQH